ncbi:di-heme oxidoredictase family protein [Microbulbifer sp. ANSA003]|uniref:di-heme oxidoredictase family protein n=1 Tax=Microbulbifer sp. ANSA003 TaxID=3243360 RepID=UPI0040436B16
MDPYFKKTINPLAKIYLTAFFALFIMVLSGCGGGGGDNSSDEDPTEATPNSQGNGSTDETPTSSGDPDESDEETPNSNSDPAESDKEVGQNIAGSGTISSSSGNGVLAIDDLRRTLWESGDTANTSSLTLDLKSTHLLSKVVIDWGDHNAKSYEVLGSSDGTTWTTLATADSGEYGQRIDSHLIGGEYRYIQLNGTELSEGSSQYSLWELMVFDRAAEEINQTASIEYTPLFDTEQPEEESQHWYIQEDGTIVTLASGRARLRHESEDSFYEFPTFYFEHRTFGIEIHDHTPAGENLIEIFYSAEYALYRPPECRSSYSNEHRADFNSNARFDETPYREADEDGRGQVWVCRITYDAHDGDDGQLEVGEWMEVEFQQFIGIEEGDENVSGQTVYYTDTYRILLGQPGIHMVADLETETAVESAGEATAAYIRATDPVPASEVISVNTDDNTLTYYAGSDGKWATASDADAVEVTYPILDGIDVYDTYIVDSGIADWTAYFREALNIQWETHNEFLDGRRIFHTRFNTGEHEELGNPDFNQMANLSAGLTIEQSCLACHINNGRGPAPSEASVPNSMVFKLSSGAITQAGQPLPNHYFGPVLQTHSLNSDIAPEGSIQVTYSPIQGSYANGDSYTLQSPTYVVTTNEGENTSADYFSPRMPQNITGLGLLEAVDETEILEWHDPNDSNSDGISGRVSLVDTGSTPLPQVGRFGWKATQPSLRSFSADALNNDIGVNTALEPNANCGIEQLECKKHSNHNEELTDSHLDDLTTYLQALGAPPRNPDLINESIVAQGEALFESINCSSCHRPEMNTNHAHPLEELRGKVIRPYTDLLLHDMGEGLADNLTISAEYNREWRTPPLWGLGVNSAVNGHSNLLHDGRARSIEEAILWHGGEAAESQQNYIDLSASERNSLLKFLQSL